MGHPRARCWKGWGCCKTRRAHSSLSRDVKDVLHRQRQPVVRRGWKQSVTPRLVFSDTSMHKVWKPVSVSIFGHKSQLSISIILISSQREHSTEENNNKKKKTRKWTSVKKCLFPSLPFYVKWYLKPKTAQKTGFSWGGGGNLKSILYHALSLCLALSSLDFALEVALDVMYFYSFICVCHPSVEALVCSLQYLQYLEYCPILRTLWTNLTVNIISSNDSNPKRRNRRCFLFCWNIVDLYYILLLIIYAIQTSDSVMHTCMINILFHILFHYGLSEDIEYSFLYCTVGPGCLSILYIVVCIC